MPYTFMWLLTLKWISAKSFPLWKKFDASLTRCLPITISRPAITLLVQLRIREACNLVNDSYGVSNRILENWRGFVDWEESKSGSKFQFHPADRRWTTIFLSHYLLFLITFSSIRRSFRSLRFAHEYIFYFLFNYFFPLANLCIQLLSLFSVGSSHLFMMVYMLIIIRALGNTQGWQTRTRIRRERGGRGIYVRDADADALGNVISRRRTRTRWFLTASPRPCAFVVLGRQFRNELMQFCSLERTNVCDLKSDDSYCIKTCNLSSLCDVLTLLKR